MISFDGELAVILFGHGGVLDIPDLVDGLIAVLALITALWAWVCTWSEPRDRP